MVYRIDLLVAVCLVVLGVIVAWMGASVPSSFLDTRFGAGFLPILIGAALALLAGGWLIEILLTARRDERHGATRIKDVLKPALLTLLFLAFILNMELGGLAFYPSAALFAFLAACLIGERTPKMVAISAAVAVGGTSLAWALFTHVFLVIIR